MFNIYCGMPEINSMQTFLFMQKYGEVWQNSIVAYIDLDRPFETKKKIKSLSDDESVIVMSASPSLESVIKVLADQV